MYRVTGIVGMFMIAAPYIFTYSDNTTALWTSIISGIVVAGASLWEAVATRKENWEYWVAVIVGIFAIAAPFVLGFGHIISATWTTVIAGTVIAVLAGYKVLGGPSKT